MTAEEPTSGSRAIHSFPRIATDSSRRVGLIREIDHLGGWGEVPGRGQLLLIDRPVWLGARCEHGQPGCPCDHGLNGDDHDPRRGRETHVDH
jgi:hypothetical protein